MSTRGEGTGNRRRKTGTSYWPSKKTTEFRAGGGVESGERQGGMVWRVCIREPEFCNRWTKAQASADRENNASLQTGWTLACDPISPGSDFVVVN